MSSPLHIPSELKKITQFIRRAEELDRDTKRPESRLVAYYCRQYAVHVGISLSKSAVTTKCLSEILTALESEKEAMSVFTMEESRLICRNFAMDVFDKADAQDRNGNSGKGNAKAFYAAATFLEILQHFDANEDTNGEDGNSESKNEEEKKRIYSKWKATEILKALKEGRKITPGGYQENANLSDDENFGEEDNLLPHAPSSLPEASSSHDSNNGSEDVEVTISAPSPEPFDLPPPPYDDSIKYNNEQDEENIVDNDVRRNGPHHQPLPPAISPPPSSPQQKKESNSFLGGFGKKSKQKRNKEMMADAIELTKFALAALESNEVELAMTRLQQALGTLRKDTFNSASYSLSGFNNMKQKKRQAIEMTSSALSALNCGNYNLSVSRISQTLEHLKM